MWLPLDANKIFWSYSLLVKQQSSVQVCVKIESKEQNACYDERKRFVTFWPVINV